MPEWNDSRLAMRASSFADRLHGRSRWAQGPANFAGNQGHKRREQAPPGPTRVTAYDECPHGVSGPPIGGGFGLWTGPLTPAAASRRAALALAEGRNFPICEGDQEPAFGPARTRWARVDLSVGWTRNWRPDRTGDGQPRRSSEAFPSAARNGAN